MRSLLVLPNTEATFIVNGNRFNDGRKEGIKAKLDIVVKFGKEVTQVMQVLLEKVDS